MMNYKKKTLSAEGFRVLGVYYKKVATIKKHQGR
jgi:magnesium-transporting ATPase (P-type)